MKRLIPARDPDVVFIRAQQARATGPRSLKQVVRDVGRSVLAFFYYVREVWQRRALVRVLAARELKSDYEMNIVGFVWWLLEPLSMAAVYYVLINILAGGRGGPEHFVSILVSLLSYKWLSQSLVGSMGVVRANSSLVTDLYFPRALLPLTELVVGLAHYAVGLCILPFFMLGFGIEPSGTLLWLPIVIAAQFILVLGLSYPLAVVGLHYRNLPSLMSNMLRLWFYLSPGLYTLDEISNGRLRTLMQFNPLTGLFEGYRGALLTDASPDWTLAYTAGVGLVAVVLGGWYFSRREPHFGKLI